MKNHFIMPYYGNKREEVIKLYSVIDITKYDIVIEPYCGSSAFSYYIWTQNKDKDITYVLNDNNVQLIELYKLCQDEKAWKKFSDDIIELNKNIDCKQKYIEHVKAAKTNLLSYLYINKVYNIRPGLYNEEKPRTVNILSSPVLEFLRTAKIVISHDEGLECYKKYCKNPKALLFLDPPYLMSENSWYKNPSLEIYEYLHYNDIDLEPSKIILCLNNCWIMDILFKNKKKITYDKIYQTTKKVDCKHVIIENAHQ